jgi:hypothetical protein
MASLGAVDDSRLAAHLREARPVAFVNVDGVCPQRSRRNLWARQASHLGFQFSPRAVVWDAPAQEWCAYHEEVFGERLEPRVAPEAFCEADRGPFSKPSIYFPLVRSSRFDRAFPNADTFLSRWSDSELARCFEKESLPALFGAERVVRALPLEEVVGRDRVPVCEGLETDEVLLRGPASIQGNGILRVTLARLRELGAAAVCKHPALCGALADTIRAYPFIPEDATQEHLEVVVSVVNGELDLVQPLAQVTRNQRKYGVRSTTLDGPSAASVACGARLAADHVVSLGVKTCVVGFDAALLRDGRILVYDFNPCVTQGVGPLLNAARLGRAAFRSAVLVVADLVPFDTLRRVVIGSSDQAAILGYFRNERYGRGHTTGFLNVFGADSEDCERYLAGIVEELSTLAQVVAVYH